MCFTTSLRHARMRKIDFFLVFYILTFFLNNLVQNMGLRYPNNTHMQNQMCFTISLKHAIMLKVNIFLVFYILTFFLVIFLNNLVQNMGIRYPNNTHMQNQMCFTISLKHAIMLKVNIFLVFLNFNIFLVFKNNIVHKTCIHNIF